MASEQPMVDAENFDPELRVIAFDGVTPYEVFSQVTRPCFVRVCCGQ